MWLVRKSRFESERRARVNAEARLEHCAKLLADAKTFALHQAHTIKELRKESEDDPSLCYA